MKAIVIGATGATGRFVVEELLNDPFFDEITVVVRRPSFTPTPKLTELVVDFDYLQDYKNQLVGDVAFSCLGTTLKDAGSKESQWKVDYDYQYKFASLCAENKVKTFVLLSAINANAKSSIFYSKMKGKLEEAITQLPFKHIQIVQPSMLVRPNSTRKGEVIMAKWMVWLDKYNWIPKKYKPIQVEILARLIVQRSKHTSLPFEKLSLEQLL
jgi:uncharacterized protein YbjT (DUF2867 family)